MYLLTELQQWMKTIIALLANTPTQAESLLHSLEQTAGSIGFYVNANKTEYICFNRERPSSLKFVYTFTYLVSSVSSTENHVSMWRSEGEDCYW